MEYGCIAERLGHSFSKIIHGMIGSYDYTLKEIPPEKLHEFMLRRDFRGINVTIPYKQAVIPYLDHISDRAAAIGAVNTIVNKNGALYGYNTDFGGMTALIERLGLSLSGKKTLILGTGGTSKTAFALAQSLGAPEIYRVSRSGKDGALTYGQAEREHSDARVIINTTPCGMFPDIFSVPIEASCFPCLEGAADAVFNPLRTRLVLAAESRGVAAQGGLYMLVQQAVLASELFFDMKYDPSLGIEIYSKLQREKRNIVLIGMPGSGKTTVGKEVARRLGREFLDTDALIVKKTGMEITKIFKERGEPYFRRVESETVREIADRQGAVIAAGGGTVLDRGSAEALKLNGRVFFLDRQPEDLIPTADRPTADSAEKIRHLYEKRYPVYTTAADSIIKVNGDAEETARQVITDFENAR